MTKIENREYQDRAIQAAREKLRTCQRVLINAPTGAGKTVIAASIVKSAVQKDSRVLFLAHRRELISQAADKLDDFGVINHGVIMRGHAKARNTHAPVQVASVQTLIRRDLPPADLIIIDECHRAISPTYLNILENYPRAKVLGLSATPERLDGKGLDSLFEDMVVVATVPELIERGFLIRPDAYVAPVDVDLTKVKKVRGDYAEGALQDAMDTPELVGDVVEHYIRHGRGLPAVAFASGVQHSQHLADAFQREGIGVAHLDGETPNGERSRIIADWRAGKIQVVTNVQVLTEGFDFPGLYCCILARPTKSVSLYLQMVGRVMRPDSGKPGALILDHGGLLAEHGPPWVDRVWTLQGEVKKKRDPRLIKTCKCGFAFERNPVFWMADIQDSSNPDIAIKQRKLLAAGQDAQELTICPSCRETDCPVCGDRFIPQAFTRGYEDIDATYEACICPHCKTLFTDNAVHESVEQAEKELPSFVNLGLVLFDESMADGVEKKIVIKNEFNRMMNEAKLRGWKRGYVYHRIIEQFGEDAKQYIPRRKGEWWKEVAQ